MTEKPRHVRLLELAVETSSCTDCRLSETRTQVVFGVGSPKARVMFVGEAPGANEDEQGEPFVGAAGQLLDRLIEEIGLSRSEVYITNVLKCRPPNNRDPKPDEIESCKGYLATQMELVEPEVVVTLGNFATKLILRTETGITKMRGQIYDWWRGIQVVPTFHPSAALRGASSVTDAMQADFVLVRSVLTRLSSSPRLGNSRPVRSASPE